jgi:hypothetical protein
MLATLLENMAYSIDLIVFNNICPNSEAKREILTSIGHPNWLELMKEDGYFVGIPLSQLTISWACTIYTSIFFQFTKKIVRKKYKPHFTWSAK